MSKKPFPIVTKLRKISATHVAIALSVVATTCAIPSLIISTLTYVHRPTKLINSNQNSNNSVTFSENSITSVANTVSKSVVSILTETRRSSLFGENTSTGSGTGVILTANGHVITNRHVVGNASKVRIITSDGTVYDDVSISGFDPVNDIAYLKINNANNLSPAKLGDSKTLVIGQPVIAIGNALGEFAGTVTNGIISGLGRSIVASDSSQTNQERLSDMLQTNASINPGNSGGPLVNAAGEIIGINTAVSKSAQGIGFAIPISSIKGTIKRFIEQNKVERAYLGVNYLNIDSNVAKEYNLPVKSGAYVFTDKKYSAIIKGSPADKAGLKDKDIVTAVGGVPIGSRGSMATLIGEYSVGDTVSINVIRDGKELSLNITLEAFPNTTN